MASDPDINDRATRSVARNYPGRGDIDESDWQRYWNQVEKTLADVFDVDNPPEKLERLKWRIAQARMDDDEDFQASIYHLDPFQIAADLSGAEVITDEQKEKYGAVLKDFSSARGMQVRSLCYDRELLDEAEDVELVHKGFAP